MADLRIVDAPEIPTENITGKEKLPTGGSGNYSISLDSLADYTKTKKDLADNTSVDGKVNGVRQELEAHVEDLLNPHQVTKGQIGLGNVDNTADADKPVSNSTQAAIISAVSTKADKSYVDNALSSKSDKTYVDSQLALKANKVDVYTKLETYTKQESSDLVNSKIDSIYKNGAALPYDSEIVYNDDVVVVKDGILVQKNGNKWESVSGIKSVESIADLILIKNPTDGQLVHVNRYSEISKNVGGVDYYWNPISTELDNGFETIKSPQFEIGRWKAIFKNNVINAWSVGYVGDGETSNHLVHEKVSKFLNSSNESWELLFTDGSFMFNNKYKQFWLVSNVKYNVTGTAIIKGGIDFDDDIIWFSSQYDKSKPLENTSIVGNGIFDMSETGLQRTSYKVRVVFYILNPINLLIDGLTFKGGDFTQTLVTGETQHAATSRDVLIKNCKFDMQVSSDVTSNNYDFTCIYTQARNTVIRNNIFYTSNIRARCISTAVEFHTKDCTLDSNIINDLAVGVYIAPQEQQDTSNIQITNNTGRLSNLFVSFWANGGVDREVSNIYISGNNIKQNLYPDAATLVANGLTVKTEGLRFISFIHTDGFSATEKFSSSGIFVTNNTFTHVDTNDQCCLLYFFCNPPENIHFSNNTLNVSSFTGSSGTVTNGLKNIFIVDNTIDSRYLSGSVAPFNLSVSSLTNCLFDMSDVRYLTVDAKSIPMFSFGSASIDITLSTIIEGRNSWNMYSRSTYPSSLFGNANANKVGIVIKTKLTIPKNVVGSNVVYTDASAYNKLSSAEVLYFGTELNSSLVVPDTLRKRSGDGLAFVGVGYTNPQLDNPIVGDVWLYLS